VLTLTFVSCRKVAGSEGLKSISNRIWENLRGTIDIPSSLDKVETAVLAASLETIDRIGPCIGEHWNHKDRRCQVIKAKESDRAGKADNV